MTQQKVHNLKSKAEAKSSTFVGNQGKRVKSLISKGEVKKPSTPERYEVRSLSSKEKVDPDKAGGGQSRIGLVSNKFEINK